MCLRSNKSTPESRASDALSEQINSELKKESHKKPQHHKLLLLGTGESGKSTFAKQMSLIYNTGGLSAHYIETFVPTLRENAIVGMKTLLTFLEQIGHTFPIELKDDAEIILASSELSPEVARAIVRVWGNRNLQELTKVRGDDAQIPGGICGAQYYFKHCERFAQPNFKPTNEDMLHARRKTTGIVETEFSAFDVGGQRSERKKWLHCFVGVTAVLFLTAINEYDMVLEEDVQTNRLVESLKLWKALTSSHYFKTTPFILFLNKSDLFQEKVKESPLNQIFSDYNDFVNKNPGMNNDFEKGWKYIGHQYRSISTMGYYPHLTCALDTKQCEKVFGSVRDTVIKSVMVVSEFK